MEQGSGARKYTYVFYYFCDARQVTLAKSQPRLSGSRVRRIGNGDGFSFVARRRTMETIQPTRHPPDLVGENANYVETGREGRYQGLCTDCEGRSHEWV